MPVHGRFHKLRMKSDSTRGEDFSHHRIPSGIPRQFPRNRFIETDNYISLPLNTRTNEGEDFGIQPNILELDFHLRYKAFLEPVGSQLLSDPALPLICASTVPVDSLLIIIISRPICY